MEYCKKRNCKQHLRYYYDGKEKNSFTKKNAIEDKS